MSKSVFLDIIYLEGANTIMKAVSLEILSKYENQYIALSKDRAKIIASGKTIKDLEKKLGEMKIKNAVIEFVEPLNAYLSPVCQ